jgi:hypothetical protein
MKVTNEFLDEMSEAMLGSYKVEPDGTHVLVGADFSNYDVIHKYFGENASYTDVIKALISEINRLKYKYELVD